MVVGSTPTGPPDAQPGRANALKPCCDQPTRARPMRASNVWYRHSAASMSRQSPGPRSAYRCGSGLGLVFRVPLAPQGYACFSIIINSLRAVYFSQECHQPLGAISHLAYPPRMNGCHTIGTPPGRGGHLAVRIRRQPCIWSPSPSPRERVGVREANRQHARKKVTSNRSDLGPPRRAKDHPHTQKKVEITERTC